MLTEAQRRELQRADESKLGIVELLDGRRGLRRSGWERMMNRLCQRGYASPYLHGGYEITSAGREALKDKDNG